MSRKRYTKEFKQEACRLIVEQGQKQSETAKNLGVSESILGRWVRQYRENGWWPSRDPVGCFRSRRSFVVRSRSLSASRWSERFKKKPSPSFGTTRNEILVYRRESKRV